ncbi:hypothetical protein [Xanthocytophaga agilis]|uniref:DUF4412 domain-containing protein n=1 Tax=Xanthocytophaga agilis TaxID=3048010 RepID=A0AAE3QXV5_9BACT|nr:hypothetical protein [Xanthocytophaga agilis]MDJ1499475.1 hypothetical protein [Xanthocytophaga agilis]
MKKIILTFWTLLITIILLGQDFEGKITYTNSYKSNNPQVSDTQWSTFMGNKYEYFIKGGSYKTTANGTLLQWQLYVNKDNKLYTKMANSEAVFWNDGATNPDSVLNAQINKGVAKVLGYTCDELILTCKSGTQKYYFNSKLSVTKNLFTKHKLGNWAEYISKANALPLKLVIENPQFILESVATEVVPQKLDAKLFLLPEGIQTEKSPY